MSIFEYDKEKEEKKLRKAEYEHGLEDGITEVITKMHKNGFTVEQIASAIDKSVEEIKDIIAGKSNSI